MDIWYVYILKCSNDRYYIWSTNNVERRFQQHSLWKSLSTKYILPVELICVHQCDSLSEARTLEYSLKKQKSRKVIDDFILSHLK